MDPVSQACDRCGATPAPNIGYCQVGPLVLRELHFCLECVKHPPLSPDPGGPFGGMWPVDFECLRRSLSTASAAADWPDVAGYAAAQVAQIAAHFNQTLPSDIAEWVASADGRWPPSN